MMIKRVLMASLAACARGASGERRRRDGPAAAREGAPRGRRRLHYLRDSRPKTAQ